MMIYISMLKLIPTGTEVTTYIKNGQLRASAQTSPFSIFSYIA
jgi:hypothetical protein